MQDTNALLRDGLLAVLLLVALVIDVRTLRVPNRLSFGGAIAGLLASLLPAHGLPGFGQALAGLATGLVLMLPLYATRVVGAGDAKLAAVCGAFLGAPQVVVALVFSFIAAGLLALGFAAWRGVLRKLLVNVRGLVQANASALVAGGGLDLRVHDSAGTFPFASALCVGTLTLLALVHLV
ncbi:MULTISPECIES: prepilin peptidase [Ramlibacter]|uniref:Prepilin peptidase n=1 Tax=Ramlibacter aquaticus TaxID=2780094 RepID=A0ABR9SJ59_9BURK|nr:MULTISPECIES: prepilin peptidase [Ramlibacter]MBE7942385.1 prepilin peptidase [Ramlibacter aquaticus]